MSALEQELIEKIRKLDAIKQKQILDFVRQVEEAPTDHENWSDRARALRLKLRDKYGANHFDDNQTLLDEVREERLDDLMGGR